MSLKISKIPPTLREICLEKLRTAILTGYFSSGERLIERKLSDNLGVSRTVVRESLRYLEAEGLIENIPNKGPIVAVLDWHTASQIYDIRLLLEKKAVYHCIEKLTPNTGEMLKNELDKLERAFATNDLNHLLQVSTSLYYTIFKIAEHNVAWEIVKRLNGRISRLRALTINYKDREKGGYDRVRAICEAIYLDQDTNKAQKAVELHIKEVAQIAKKIFENQSI